MLVHSLFVQVRFTTLWYIACDAWNGCRWRIYGKAKRPMEATRHYPRNPIVEAIIDLVVELPAEFDVRRLASIQEALGNGFVLDNAVQVSSVELQPGISFGVQEALVGYQFRSIEQAQVLRASRDRFTFSQLKPYKTWEDFFHEGRRLWAIYVDVCRPTTTTRAAIRYINNLVIPREGADYRDYLEAYPHVPQGLSESVSGYVMQVRIPVDNPECVLVVTQVIPEEPVNPNFTIILDFDISRVQNWEGDGGEDVWTFLDSLRSVKNRAFEESITDQTRRLISE